MSARQAKAVDHVAGLVEAIKEGEADLRRTRFGHNLAEIWRTSALGQWPASMKLWPPESVTHPGAQEARRLVNLAQDACVALLWQQHRIVYDLDPTLWLELSDTDEETIVPSGLMRQLPHPDPYISFPSPVVIPVRPNEVMAVLGFFVNGRASGPEGETLVSTHSDKAKGSLGLLFGGPVVDTRTGRGVSTGLSPNSALDMIWTRLTLDLEDGDVTVGHLIQGMIPRFERMGDGSGGFDCIPPLTKAAVSALVYLCATNADLAPAQRMARPPARRSMGGKAEVVPVGFHVGAAIRKVEADVRRSGGTTVRVSATLRSPVRPHIRRAHFHTYRVGKGRAEKIVKWLAPVAVNVPASGATVPTVVPVR